MFESIEIGTFFGSIMPSAMGTCAIEACMTSALVTLDDGPVDTSATTTTSALTLGPVGIMAHDIEETMQTTESYIESLSAEELEDLAQYLSEIKDDDTIIVQIEEIKADKSDSDSKITYKEIQTIEDSLDSLTVADLKKVKGYLEFSDKQAEDSKTKTYS